MDLLLSAFIQSTEEPESDRLMGELIFVHATPYIRRTLKQRLGLYVGQSGANPNCPQAEDLYQDVVTKVIQWLNDLKKKPGQKVVKNFGQYVSRIAYNVCNDYLREKSPARYRLKSNLRDLFESRSEFTLWKNSSNVFFCGFKPWSNVQPPTQQKSADDIEDNIDLFRTKSFPDRDINRIPLPELVAAIFNWTKAAIEFDHLVNVVAQILNLKEQTEEPLEIDNDYWNQRLIDSTIRIDSIVEQRDSVRAIWDNIKALPLKQRQALCLSLRCEDGTDMLTLLSEAKAVAISQVAKDLAIELTTLMAIWKEMPMDNAAIAAQIGATREQVNKWRFRAFQKLAKNLALLSTKK